MPYYKRILIIHPFSAYFFEESDGTVIFGILDGHNGRSVVEYVTTHLPRKLLNSLTAIDTEWRVEDILKKQFLSMDEELKTNLPERSSAHTGATCSVCVVRVENNEKVLYTANIGDTQAFLFEKTSIGLTSTELTENHRSDKPIEMARVKSAGSYVSLNRIEGKLEVFRGFGDFSFKTKGFIAEPTISRRVLCSAIVAAAAEKETARIILACDGLWDFATPTAIHNVVDKYFDSTNTTACELKSLAKRSRSTDNITVMAVSIML